MAVRTSAIRASYCPGPAAARIIRILGIAAACVVMGVTGLSIWDGYVSCLREARSFRLFLAQKIDLQLAASLRNVDAILLDVRARIRSGELSAHDLAALLTDRVGFLPESVSATVTDASGIITAGTAPEAIGLDVSERSYFKAHADSGVDSFFLSAPFLTLTDKFVMVASRPVWDDKGEFAGVVGIALTPAFFQAMLEAALPPRHGGITLLGRDLLVRMRVPDPPPYLGRNLKGAEFTERFIASGQKSQDYRVVNSIDGVERLVVFHGLEFPPDLVVAVSESASAVLDPWRTRSLIHVLAALAGAGSILLLTRYCIRAVTAAALSDEALRRSEVLFSTLLRNLPVEAWARDTAGRVIFQSENCVQRWGDLRGKPFQAESVPPETLALWQGRNERAFRGETFSVLEEEILPDGTRRPTRTFLGPIRDERGAIGILGINVDMTEQLKLEAEHLESKQKYETFVEGTDDLIVSVDTHGRLLFANGRAERFFGMARGGLDGASLFDLVHPGDREDTRAAFDSWTSAGAPKAAFENRMTDNEGSARHMRWTVNSFLGPDGELAGFNGIVHDVTAIKQAEEAVRRSLREKEVMLKEIHHRVKNNLQIILSLLSLQGGDEAGEGPIARIFGRIRAMALVHEQLYQSSDLSAVDLARYIPDLTRRIASAYAGLGVRVAQDIEAHDVFLRIDQAVPFGLLLNELLTNAFKHAFNGSSGSELKVGLRRNGTFVELVVADSGQGLPEGFSLAEQDSLGAQLLLALAAQLGGTIEAFTQNGAVFRLLFRPG